MKPVWLSLPKLSWKHSVQAEILVLSDGRPGHLTQSHGLLDLLGEAGNARRELLLPTPRRALKRLVLILTRLPLRSAWWWRFLLACYYAGKVDVPSARLLVSTGGDTLAANILMARLLDVHNIFIGKPVSVARTGTSLVVTTSPVPDGSNCIRITLAPVRRSTSTEMPSANLVAVLIGGDSNEYRYTVADYEALAIALNSLCRRTKSKLLVTTSRRTGPHGEHCLQRQLAPEYIADATWYLQEPRPTAGKYAACAAMIICSEDSGSMLTESIGHEKPVVAFRPRHSHLTPFYEDFLARLSRQGLLRSNIEDLATLQPDTCQAARPVNYDALVARVLPLLRSST